MIPVRRHDWRSRLSGVIEEALQRPFEWGHHDCALFAADAVLAMTGADHATFWRGRYRTPLGAMRILGRGGYEDHVDYVAAHLAEVHPALAAVGDIAVIGSEDGPALGIVTGPGIAVPGPSGLGFAPRAAAIRAFHVPFAGEAG
ncbi:MAG: hypothetical protein V9G18_10040 [Albidovulum sp.]|jgi:hypothetical protein|uniref:DUF6950 family protein n=1 Tax=Albidovulum sp. TaxID=1872424 RepID=UPI00303555C5